MFTRHGHQIPGTPAEKPSPASVARCGGPSLCQECRKDVAYAKFSNYIDYDESAEKPMDFQLKAKIEVVQWCNANMMYRGMPLTVDEVFVVWFSKTLQNWKALVATVREDDAYFECTYNGDKKEMYLDAYTKTDNQVISDIL